MKYHLVAILLLVAALPLYVVGFSMGGMLVLGVAFALEVWFWIRMVGGRPRHNVPNESQ